MKVFESGGGHAMAGGFKLKEEKTVFVAKLS